MWCGTFEPRKNLATLLRAFEIARESDADLGLVLVGPPGWGDVAVPTTPGVRLLGFLEPRELHLAYAGARAFCYPSLREGFGLPVLEAMAHGVPVVTSAGTAMAEFAEGAGILVDPLDADAMAAAIIAAAGDEHNALARAAAKRANDYTWDTAAAATVDAYREAVEA
jgi:glycosyltransferase involved in cell wall biosynthesis